MPIAWKQKQIKRLSTAVVACQVLHKRIRLQRKSCSAGRQTLQKRQRRSVAEVYKMLGPYCFRRALWMFHESFNKHAAKIKPFMIGWNFAKATSNGPIFHTVHLACALRYFAGGASYGIATIFAIAPLRSI